ncbi:peptidase associated/transthyretin-like domain-containing protein [Paludisphaera rhizosphaerae]|uniref:hypothetical protein n=1 Tax=Paludisphaera rhizosphaerae TaxID=2711216 RepID=UPI0013EDE51D|nr:hypothetical protein [Paludisphaera rhizosphaerae]
MPTNRLVLVVFISAAVVGCAGEGISAPRTVPTSGTVMFKGKPVAGVKVTLHPKFNMTFTPNGMTGQDGRFVLSTAAPMDGAPPGEYSVTFELLKTGADKRGLDTEFDVWKGKHANPDTGPKATVGSSETTLEPFLLD